MEASSVFLIKEDGDFIQVIKQIQTGGYQDLSELKNVNSPHLAARRILHFLWPTNPDSDLYPSH